MPTTNTNDTFFEELYSFLRPNTRYDVKVEITPGQLVIGTTEIMNCERQIEVNERECFLVKLVTKRLRFDSEKEREECIPESRDDFYHQLQKYLTSKSNGLGLEQPELITDENGFVIKSPVYNGEILPRRERAARFGDLASRL